jgi:hypothetical protein
MFFHTVFNQKLDITKNSWTKRTSFNLCRNHILFHFLFWSNFSFWFWLHLRMILNKSWLCICQSITVLIFLEIIWLQQFAELCLRVPNIKSCNSLSSISFNLFLNFTISCFAYTTWFLLCWKATIVSIFIPMGHARVYMASLTLITFESRKFFTASIFLTSCCLSLLIVIVYFLLLFTITFVHMSVPNLFWSCFSILANSSFHVQTCIAYWA